MATSHLISPARCRLASVEAGTQGRALELLFEKPPFAVLEGEL